MDSSNAIAFSHFNSHLHPNIHANLLSEYAVLFLQPAHSHKPDTAPVCNHDVIYTCATATGADRDWGVMCGSLKVGVARLRWAWRRWQCKYSVGGSAG